MSCEFFDDEEEEGKQTMTYKLTSLSFFFRSTPCFTSLFWNNLYHFRFISVIPCITCLFVPCRYIRIMSPFNILVIRVIIDWVTTNWIFLFFSFRETHSDHRSIHPLSQGTTLSSITPLTFLLSSFSLSPYSHSSPNSIHSKKFSIISFFPLESDEHG